MGVLSCNRYGCTNIMCSRLSPEYGYICDDCFEELVNSGIDTDIEEFMRSEKNENNKYCAAEKYGKIFELIG